MGKKWRKLHSRLQESLTLEKYFVYATNRNRRSMNGKLKRMVFKLGIHHHAFAERGPITPMHEIFGSRVFMQ
jgi:hypothetical protein